MKDTKPVETNQLQPAKMVDAATDAKHTKSDRTARLENAAPNVKHDARPSDKTITAKKAHQQ